MNTTTKVVIGIVGALLLVVVVYLISIAVVWQVDFSGQVVLVTPTPDPAGPAPARAPDITDIALVTHTPPPRPLVLAGYDTSDDGNHDGNIDIGPDDDGDQDPATVPSGATAPTPIWRYATPTPQPPLRVEILSTPTSLPTATPVPTTAAPPGQPGGLTVDAVTASTADLSWSADTSADGYIVTWWAADVPPRSGSTTGTTYTVASLLEGTRYTAYVVSTLANAANSAPATARFTTAVAIPSIGQVFNLRMTEVTPTAFTVAWDAMPHANEYSVAVAGLSPIRVAGTSQTVSGLSQNTTYQVTVQARLLGDDLTELAAGPVSASLDVITGLCQSPGTPTQTMSVRSTVANHRVTVSTIWAQTDHAVRYQIATRIYSAQWATVPASHEVTALAHTETFRYGATDATNDFDPFTSPTDHFMGGPMLVETAIEAINACGEKSPALVRVMRVDIPG